MFSPITRFIKRRAVQILTDSMQSCISLFPYKYVCTQHSELSQQHDNQDNFHDINSVALRCRNQNVVDDTRRLIMFYICIWFPERVNRQTEMIVVYDKKRNEVFFQWLKIASEKLTGWIYGYFNFAPRNFFLCPSTGLYQWKFICLFCKKLKAHSYIAHFTEISVHF